MFLRATDQMRFLPSLNDFRADREREQSQSEPANHSEHEKNGAILPTAWLEAGGFYPASSVNMRPGFDHRNSICITHGDFNSRLCVCRPDFRFMNSGDFVNFFGCFFTQTTAPHITR